MNRIVGGFGVAATAVLALTVVSNSSPVERRIDIASVGALRTVDELRAAADVIVVVRHDGSQREHWTSDDNRQWKAADGSGAVALIVRDEDVIVLRSMKGTAAPGDSLTVRGIGGFADGVRMHFDGMEELNSGSTYLLFLKRVDWPTREGFDQDVLTPVAHGQGVFLQGTNGLKNAASVEITSVDEISLPD